MADRNRPHLFVDGRVTAEDYSRRAGGGGGQETAAPADRAGHARRLITALQQADEAARQRRGAARTLVPDAVLGVYVSFESFPGLELALTSLDPQRGQQHPELRSVHLQDTQAGPVQVATVFIPDGKLGTFVRAFEQYESTASDAKPKNWNMVDRVAEIAAATVRALWTDASGDFPAAGQTVWWEVWLRRRDGNEVGRFSTFAEAAGCPIAPTRLSFHDRTVLLVQATAEQLAGAIDVLDDLAELRRPHHPDAVLALENAAGQAEWVSELAGRLQPADGNAPAACVLDTGVDRAHPLLNSSLAEDDQHACDPNWGLEDRTGHGTEMAGLALFGDLGEALTSTGPVRPTHRLESVKLLPDRHQDSPPHLWGALTATGVSLVEIQAPSRRRSFSMAVTAPDETALAGQETQAERVGRPTSWSAAVDALAAGRAIDTHEHGLVYLDDETERQPRLFVISAGNVRSFDDDHLSRSDLEPIEDPAQAWNALTVGAYTELVHLDGQPSFAGWTPLAPAGELSPWSRTSVALARTWPPKPDVILEGGNVARSPDGTAYDWPEVLQLLTTRRRTLGESRLLTVTNATSAATAQAAHLAASIMATYPALWPEAVRALIVHSARWTPAMKTHLAQATSRNKKDSFRRRYGLGVPDLARATRSANDALTLISQETIEPFDGQGRTRQLHLHDLPWPTDVLADLGNANVRLRVTLSYFIEPNPANRGWRRRYSYQSHGLRFDLRRATESTTDFRKRINDKALDEDERRPLSADSDANEWLFGPRAHGSGSIHTDIWTGTAADLARRGTLAVYPVTGWWKENPSRDRSHRGARYALVVSIETPGQDVDIWTPVATQIGIPIQLDT
jgi:hypothetical protein